MKKNKKYIKGGKVHIYDPVVIPEMRRYCDKKGIKYTPFVVEAIKSAIHRTKLK